MKKIFSVLSVLVISLAIVTFSSCETENPEPVSRTVIGGDVTIQYDFTPADGDNVIDFITSDMFDAYLCMAVGTDTTQLLNLRGATTGSQTVQFDKVPYHAEFFVTSKTNDNYHYTEGADLACNILLTPQATIRYSDGTHTTRTFANESRQVFGLDPSHLADILASLPRYNVIVDID